MSATTRQPRSTPAMSVPPFSSKGTRRRLTPLGATRIPQPLDRLREDLGRVPGRVGHDIPAIADNGRVHEMLVQVVGVLGGAVVELAADGDVINDRDVLDVLAETEAAGMGTHGHAELGGQQQYGKHLVEAAQPTGI